MVKRIKTIEKIFLLIATVVILIIFGRYFYTSTKTLVNNVVDFVQDLRLKCGDNEVRLRISGGYICRSKDIESSVWKDIFDNYPKTGKGREIAYSFLDKGSIEVADKYLEDIYQIDRYEDFKIEDEITWEEDPFDERYWRFMFYSLRHTRHLLYAGIETENEEYFNELKDILESFADVGMEKEQSWEDYHAVAFRSMVLTNSWYKLREHNQLSYELSTKLLKSIKVHGDFLLDNNHYEAEYNHGINQATALLVLAVNFPELDDGGKWLEISKRRLNSGIADIVDGDGILVENSPYYHFYAMEKYWEIYNYAKDNDIELSSEFESKIDKTISYATYILHPNLRIPIIGASLDREINFSREYKDISKQDDEFLYVLTRGEDGKEPSNKSIYYPVSGQTIMRSGWGKGDDFEKQTQIIFDIGPYRTEHSDLDALNFVLYSQSQVLIGDSGLYTYEEGKYKDYFHGTSAHNTVVVDGKDQKVGSAIAITFFEDDEYSYQTASQNLNDGVEHSRAVVLLEDDLVLVLDSLISGEDHVYEQKFHLNPDAEIDVNNLKLNVKGKKVDFNIRQLIDNGTTVGTIKGQEEPVDGWCSFVYEEKVPCYSVSYKQENSNAFFATLITIGDIDNNLVTKIDKDNKNIEISTGKKVYNINVETMLGEEEIINVSNNEINSADKKQILSFNRFENWNLNSSDDYVYSYFDDTGLILTGMKPEAEIKKTIDLSHSNLWLRMKIENAMNAVGASILLSNDNWNNYASFSLLNPYRYEYNEEWLDISIGKSGVRERGGQWRFGEPGFDWSKIDSIKFRSTTNNGAYPKIFLDGLYTIPEQEGGSVVIVFDDGHKTVLKAADIMREHGIKGNIAVIADRPGINTNYLYLDDLKKLQNEDDWNMVNHSTHHRNAVTYYYDKNNLSDYERDVVGGLKYLEDNDINSAPNWYIYPHGATNEEIKNILSKYYKFARTTINSPEVYPFADPYGVKTFSVYDDTPVSAIDLAVRDAKKYNTTLFLTFHRIKISQEDDEGYPVDNFEKLMDIISKQDIPVKTLSELDESNNESVIDLVIKEYVPTEIVLDIKVEKNNIIKKIYNLFVSAFSFSDDFSVAGRLEEVGSMEKSVSENWWVNSGSYFINEDGVGMTLQGELSEDDKWRIKYNEYNSDETDDGYHSQNIFRLINKNKLLNYQQEVYFKVIEDNLSKSEHRYESNALLLFSRYLDQNNLYYAGIRVDGNAVIKKKINGKYYTLASEKILDGTYNRETNTSLLTKEKWIGVRSEIKNKDNGVEITLFTKTDSGTWKQAVQVFDDGESFGGAAITKKGYSGIRTDFMDVEFDNYLLEEIK
ncbi:MAG: hypothetical protein A2725_00940 [Candidatus Magasanikbacteria bacterium RIFCSPHIGHO2_01_FULL_33_34]|uniref:NodB homology domain-containing protein n=1 Tax=Candidatus Magasanikbacteria bacterium RIFCSPHIGHO2_01_FULL_33_34 TaxID=1798671 RepID=A0A1F6LJ00_9BACT|nr:MAG: hypothetical protein A2725_00940 [Candidatus Magasanikbacteria bacterium RIFCSPHIGHO2_01_FULL_33_34]OGH65322.1 MAG: hypothetical protein A3B83_04600 [Candidatus Magasanikbacteria bacterium RIFCSPHIGHO2_02_FULL_33_17]OGH76098.1 MAG: hypothetical protein A3A89_01520 [Candidatus Magasanikbacteria bacterium RIFCSPLOWO2_01_FULL_33_34]OGH82076.1 MAG: hypothetical protein A3F93_04320 [Candidatus Magasanikbacteria bacterium RIFCSPLOWO2_12_FULL_34_7]